MEGEIASLVSCTLVLPRRGDHSDGPTYRTVGSYKRVSVEVARNPRVSGVAGLPWPVTPLPWYTARHRNLFCIIPVFKIATDKHNRYTRYIQNPDVLFRRSSPCNAGLSTFHRASNSLVTIWRIIDTSNQATVTRIAFPVRYTRDPCFNYILSIEFDVSSLQKLSIK